ncbi:MAG: AAA family ATPase, partial [Anaerolineales bacterium]|nr:AAA family ATPase [Anaerolineales bacterium]
ALYRGDFLDGFYDDWIISERYRLESLYLETLARLIAVYEADMDYQAALATALRLLDRDALREDAHQAAMRAYCHLGQRKAALEQYVCYRQTLLEELGAQPMGETTELYQAILDGRFKIGPLPKISQTALYPPGPSGRSPLDLAAPIRLVGREREIAFLEDCWHSAQAGSGNLVLIGGEVGVGKTRLVEEFTHHSPWQGRCVLWGRCFEFERSLPYQPIAMVLKTALSILPQAELAVFPAWVLREVARLAPEVRERTANHVDHPMHRRKTSGDPGAELLAAQGIDPQQALLFEGVARILAELSSQGAFLVVLEDLHWASESTLKLLHHLARHLSDYPVLFVGTFRPEEIDQEHPLPELLRQLAHDGIAWQLDLPRLSPTSVITIIEEMSGAGEAVMPLAERLYRETEGNPFFLIESVKALFETGVIQLKEGIWQGDFTLASKAKPPLTANLSDAVQARVRHLGENGQAALGLAAVLGREFNFEPYNDALGKGEEATLEVLDEFLRHRLVEEKFGPDELDFTFTHHKIQEVVYQSLPRQRRFHLHARAGAAIETIYAAELETRAGELAHHFEQACLQDKSLAGKAIYYLLQAGQQAVQQSANQEAVAYYQRGLDILHSQPETEQRMQQEVELQNALAVPVKIIKGYASPEVRQIYDQVRDLCQKLGNTPDLFTSLVGLSRYYGLRGDREASVKLTDQLLAIAQVSREDDLLIVAYSQMGSLAINTDSYAKAGEFFDRGLALYDPARHESYANRFGHDPVVTCLGYSSLVLWLRGYPDQARLQGQKLIDLIPAMTHPASQAIAYCQLAKQACLRRDPRTACAHAEAAIQCCLRNGLPSWEALAMAHKGWALSEQGQMAEGWKLLKEGTQAWLARGHAHWSPFLMALQAQVCLKMRKLQDGTDAVVAALEIVKNSGDRYWLAELHRLRGELLWSGGASGGSVEVDFQQALETARQQGARMLELRAAVSLARLQQEQGQPQAAQQTLSEVYDWFTEGFDTFDLQEANTLLRKTRLATLHV